MFAQIFRRSAPSSLLLKMLKNEQDQSISIKPLSQGGTVKVNVVLQFAFSITGSIIIDHSKSVPLENKFVFCLQSCGPWQVNAAQHGDHPHSQCSQRPPTCKHRTSLLQRHGCRLLWGGSRRFHRLRHKCFLLPNSEIYTCCLVQ